MLSLKNITYTHPKGPTLGPLTITLSPTDCLLILGPNGSGKTTLLKLLAGLLGTPYPTQTPQQLARQLTWLGPHTQPAFNFIVQDILQMGHPSTPKALTTLTTQFDLTTLLNREFLTLSSGEQQRILLARTWLQNTPFLLLDEPFEHLDIQHQHQLITLIKSSLPTQGIAISSHHWDHLAPLATHVLCLKNGQIIGYGRPEELPLDDLLAETFGIKGLDTHFRS